MYKKRIFNYHFVFILTLNKTELIHNSLNLFIETFLVSMSPSEKQMHGKSRSLNRSISAKIAQVDLVKLLILYHLNVGILK